MGRDLICKNNFRAGFVLLACTLGPATGALADRGPYLGVIAGVGSLNNSNGNVSVGENVVAEGTIKFSDGPVAGFLGGYTFENGLRPEVEVTHRRNALPGKNDARTTQYVASMYYNFSRSDYYFFLGGGGGLADVTARFEELGNYSDTVPVYSAGVGFGASVTRNLMVGFDYRFAGAIERSRFSDTVTTDDGDVVPVGASFRYRGHFFGLGLRYSFGSASFDNQPASGSRRPVQVVPVSN